MSGGVGGCLLFVCLFVFCLFVCFCKLRIIEAEACPPRYLLTWAKSFITLDPRASCRHDDNDDNDADDDNDYHDDGSDYDNDDGSSDCNNV